ncbi:hypothetical protein [Methylomonas sp. YC3]
MSYGFPFTASNDAATQKLFHENSFPEMSKIVIRQRQRKLTADTPTPNKNQPYPCPKSAHTPAPAPTTDQKKASSPLGTHWLPAIRSAEVDVMETKCSENNSEIPGSKHGSCHFVFSAHHKGLQVFVKPKCCHSNIIC